MKMTEMDQRPATQKLPAGLAGVLNRPEEKRDSAYYSSTDSKRMLTPRDSTGAPPSAHTNSNTPSPSPISTSTNLMPQPLVSPSTSNMSVASMVSPTTPVSIDHRRHERPQSLESAPNGNHWNGEHLDQPVSRRESVDSRILNQGIGDMRLGNSPYTSHNPSTTSIQNTLLQQRNPRPAHLDSLSIHRISNGYQPSNDRTPDLHPKIARTAPAITGPATGNIARAAEPTKGQAWAFPEEEIQRLPSASQSLVDSRRSSVAESLASSQFTTESRLPPGQRHLDDGLHQSERFSNEYPVVHHHTLQHKQIGELQGDAAGLAPGSQPYSRTPELRRSHKLAERKRRTEMKELFEELRDLMPQERGSKASKWEILTKAIAEHKRQADTLRSLHQTNGSLHQELEAMRRDVMALRGENTQLRNELATASNSHHGVGGLPNLSSQNGGDGYGRATSLRQELPPLRSLNNGMPGPPDTMTGVQYEQPRANGYR
ncbi:hypothetical protein M0657_003516 [Pyricularia oryzae]|uniref:BHLH domain-containing protein n=1 Tax=Pyricularia oryzae TaxID=318829 RepID=A0A4V1C561_PYROR|nr:hypothetical protein M9X92_006402 [Pyricularia oryzae]KAI7926939.1 hypothetical protein M0657_003516 [Pyricularia oryzae]QBZ55265.1 hypothetical protein PoMZ_00161 [Pyricularia oryzae]